MEVRLVNSVGMIKKCKIGFSWTTLFFGLFVPLLRGDLKNSLIMLGLACLTCGISWLVFPFIYNKMYINSLLEKGFGPSDEEDRNRLIHKDFIAGKIV